jgi:Acetyltransferase (GNAT) domain
MAERRWTTRNGTVADCDGILALRQACFGDVDPIRGRAPGWRWQFADNPAGTGYVRLAEHEGRIVGQYAAIPTRFRLRGAASPRIMAMSCDTMTHPAYQKQGMFVTLAKELYEDIATRERVTTVWGFPNDSSHPGFVGKLGWFDTHVFPTLVKPLRTRAVLQRYLKSSAVAAVLAPVVDSAWAIVAPRARPPRRCTINPVRTFDDRFAALWERHADLAAVVQVRDPAFLRWRFEAVPEFRYERWEVLVDGRLEGYFVTRTLELFGLPFGALVDMFPCPVVDDEITREVLSFTQRRVTEQGAAFLTALLPPHLAHHLRRFGFLKVPDFLNLRRWYFGARAAPDDRPLLQDIGNWYLTFGDADIV